MGKLFSRDYLSLRLVLVFFAAFVSKQALDNLHHLPKRTLSLPGRISHPKTQLAVFLDRSATMQMFLAAALFAAAGLAMPAGSFSCPGGVTNSSPQCCATNVLQLLALDCQTRMLRLPATEYSAPLSSRSCCRYWTKTCSSQRLRMPTRHKAQLLHSRSCKSNMATT